MLREGERVDDLMRGSLRIIQNPSLFRFGTDSVLLADFAQAKKGEVICDLGTGTGALPLLMIGRQRELRIDAVEIQPSLCDIAERSVQLNGLFGQIRTHHMDLREAPDRLGRGVYDCVVCNPPYYKANSSVPSMREEMRVARHEVLCTIADVAQVACALLRNGGRFCAVYPTVRAVELLARITDCGLVPKRMRAVHHTAGHSAKLMLIEAKKGAGEGLTWLPPLILREQDGSETEEVRRIYGKSDSDD